MTLSLYSESITSNFYKIQCSLKIKCISFFGYVITVDLVSQIWKFCVFPGSLSLHNFTIQFCHLVANIFRRLPSLGYYLQYLPFCSMKTKFSKLTKNREAITNNAVVCFTHCKNDRWPRQHVTKFAIYCFTHIFDTHTHPQYCVKKQLTWKSYTFCWKYFKFLCGEKLSKFFACGKK